MASLFVSKYSSGWRVIEEVWKDGKRTQRTIPRTSYQALGINPSWKLEEARRAIKRLNKQNHLERKQIIGAAKRVLELRDVDEAYLPSDLVKEFDTRIDVDSFGSPSHIKRLHSHWDFIIVMIRATRLKPSDFFENRKLIYKYFMERQLSLDYINKLIRSLNEWGYFYSYKHGSLYRPVPSPRGIERHTLDSAHKRKANLRRPSEPITPQTLMSHRTRLSTEHYNWLLISVWFGLRPEEIDNLEFKVTIEKNTPVLNVYQSKLVALPELDRWKLIPCLYPEQRDILKIIERREFKRPNAKTMRNFGKHIGVYAGRKGFELLMRERGHTIEQIASWLGHQSIRTTWEKYRNRRVASF